MRYSAEHKQRTREKILGAAGKLFRAEGYGGSGIDGLTRAAGVTNGAFYGHFKCKAEAFREVIAIGLRRFRDGIVEVQARHGRGWVRPFVAHYLGVMGTCALGDACALPMLSAEVARADDKARAVYETGFRELVDAFAAGLEGDRARSLTLISMLSGASTLLRAIPDPALRAELSQAVTQAALALAAPGDPVPSGEAAAESLPEAAAADLIRPA